MANQTWTGNDAQTFVDSYSDLPLKGNTGRTLRSYVNTHVPTWGVVVNPMHGVDVLVWYDAVNRLHVVEITGNPIVTEIIKPAYHTPDESFLYNMTQSVVNGFSVVPSFKTLTSVAMVAIAVYVGSIVFRMTRK